MSGIVGFQIVSRFWFCPLVSGSKYFMFGALRALAGRGLPKNAREPIHGGLDRAIPGAQRFWEPPPGQRPLLSMCRPACTKTSRSNWALSNSPKVPVFSWQTRKGSPGEWWGHPPKNVRSHGWRSPSAHGCARSGFWEGVSITRQTASLDPYQNRPKTSPG